MSGYLYKSKSSRDDLILENVPWPPCASVTSWRTSSTRNWNVSRCKNVHIAQWGWWFIVQRTIVLMYPKGRNWQVQETFLLPRCSFCSAPPCTWRQSLLLPCGISNGKTLQLKGSEKTFQTLLPTVRSTWGKECGGAVPWCLNRLSHRADV